MTTNKLVPRLRGPAFHVPDENASVLASRDHVSSVRMGGKRENPSLFRGDRRALESPALDAIFGREGVRIRDTFIRIGGTRIHTIETLDVKRSRAVLEAFEKPLGLAGLSFHVPDLDEAHARATSEGRAPTEIYSFSELEHPVRMFFLEDPDGLRVEMIGDD